MVKRNAIANKYLCTHLNVSDVTLGGKVHPVRLIQLGPDHVIEVRDLVILSDERSYIPSINFNNNSCGQQNVTCETQLRMCLDRRDDSTEHGGRHDVDFV